jgi:CRISPR-associated endonuclease Csn1
LRNLWGIGKNRDTDDHHAKDAICVACCNQDIINRISLYEKSRKNHDKTRLHFPMPWEKFRTDIDNWFSKDFKTPLFVSVMSNHKITGAAHEATFEKIITKNDENFFVKRVPLNKLKLTKDGKIKDYYNDGKDDTLLYDKLLKQLQSHGGDATKAFPKDTVFYKPCKCGDGNIVKTVKIVEKTGGCLKLEKVGSAAPNGDMIRIDIFSKDKNGEKQFYFVPIYVADFKKPVLPNIAVPNGEAMNETDGYVFEFSLYAKDLVKIKRKTDEKPMLFYYACANRSTGSITLFSHNKEFRYPGVGVKTLENFEKWEVDVLGNYNKKPFAPREIKTLYNKGRKPVIK